MSKKTKIKAKELEVTLPFKLGKITFINNEVIQKAAWSLYVELSTRITTISMKEDNGILRESLSSLYNIFNITRQILKDAGPEIALGTNSLGTIAIDVLNKGLRPFLETWHPLLKDYEERKPDNLTSVEYENKWHKAKDMRSDLTKVREEMLIYINALSKIAGID